MTGTASSVPLRQHLHFDSLVGQVRDRFEQIPDGRRNPEFSLSDTLMAGLAMFLLKDRSLLAFCRRCVDHNLRSVFGLKAIPSDTQMREILDEVDPLSLRPVFKDIFRQLQRAKVLEDYVFLEGSYLVCLDGVEYHCSKKVHCEHCMKREHSNGETSYYHQMLGAVIVHPDFPEVIPLAPEPIQRCDGQKKNDCERNAGERWLGHFREDHTRLSIIVLEDGLGSNAPHIQDLIAANCHFILVAKPGDHGHLLEQLVARCEAGEVETCDRLDAQTQSQHHYTFTNGLGLNKANPKVLVNVLQYVQTDADGTSHEWTWVTDLKLTAKNVAEVARGARARWRIENETFNTLKNHNYHFEHNYGHGKKNLSTVFALLMMMAFLIDQVQQKSNSLFRMAWEKKGPKCALWESVRNLFAEFEVGSMREIYEAIAFGHERPPLKPLAKPTWVGGRKKSADTS